MTQLTQGTSLCAIPKQMVNLTKRQNQIHDKHHYEHSGMFKKLNSYCKMTEITYT